MSKRDHDNVLGVAIKRGDLVCSLMKPARHHDVIRAMASIGVITPIGHDGDVQGFLTILGFQDRKQTAEMIGHKGKLFSEDLW